MMDWALPSLLTVDEVLILPNKMLQLLTDISTDIVIDRVNIFVANNINSENQDRKRAAEILRNAYARVNSMTSYLESDEAKKLATTLAELDYRDININTDLHLLKEYREQIIDFLSEDEEFVKSYSSVIKSDTRGFKQAFITKLDSENLEETLARMQDIGQISDEEYDACERLRSRIEEMPSLFKNAKNARQNTIFYRTATKTTKLKHILRGLDFLIPKMERGEAMLKYRSL